MHPFYIGVLKFGSLRSGTSVISSDVIAVLSSALYHESVWWVGS